VVGRFEYGGIDFYNADGKCKTVTPFGEIGWARRGGEGGFSEDGEYFGVIVENQRSRRALRGTGMSGEPWVILYDKNGRELWRRQVEEYIPGGFVISSHAKYILVSAYTTRGVEETREGKDLMNSVSLFLFDRSGKMTKLDDPVLFSIANFSPDESYLAIAYENKIRLVDAESGKALFEKSLPPEVETKYVTREVETPGGKRTVQEKITPYRISGVFVSSEGENALARVYKTYEKPADTEIKSRAEAIAHYEQYMKQFGHSEIFLLDIKGDIIWRKFYSAGESAPIPIAVSGGAKQIAFSFGDNKIEVLDREL
jgi:hypothetical protein